MEFLEIDDALNKVEEHLTINNSFNTQVEAYLTRYLIVYIYAQFESKIKILLKKYLLKHDHTKELELFISPFSDNLVKRLKTSAIKKNIINKLSTEKIEIFEEKLLINKNNETAYNNLIVNRNNVSHGQSSQITFLELKTGYVKSLVVLELLEEVLK